MQKAITPVVAVCSLVLIGMLSFVGTAYAADAVTSTDTSITDLLKPIYDAAIAGHYLAALAASLVVVVALLKRYSGTGPFGLFLHSDPGGAILTLLMAFGGAIATATAAGATWHWAMAWTALQVAFVAAGGYALIKKLGIPLLKKLQPTLPSFLGPVFSLIYVIFDKPDAVQDAIKAGNDAVKAIPAQGIEGVVGKTTEVA